MCKECRHIITRTIRYDTIEVIAKVLGTSIDHLTPNAEAPKDGSKFAFTALLESNLLLVAIG